jgi:outer membrane protein insertion porin family
VRFYDFSEIYKDLNPEYDLSLESWPKVTSATTFTLERDSRDMPQFATRGTYHSLSSELAGGVFGGDVDYHKEIFETQWYFPTFWGFVLSLRGRIGVVDGYRSPSTVPFSERFFPGGTSFDGMIRGYDDRSIGPRLDGLEIGGRSVLVYNLEYRFPLAEQQVYLLLFADAGNSWLSGRAISPFNLYQSVGVGVRFVIPMLGVMGFDFGYGLDRNFGGWHPHFQLGRAF